MGKYFLGEALFGDDFDDILLMDWFEEEKESYFDFYTDYLYHSLDEMYGFGFIHGSNLNVLDIGSGSGAEFLPIWDKITDLTILESSKKYKNMLIDQSKINFLLANYKGKIEVPENTFDLVVCFSTLHHIANVSFVMLEIARVLKQGGLALIREPIVSMGDWNNPRKGVTKNERGIPIKVFREIIRRSGLTIISEKLWNFRPLIKLLFLYKKSIFNNKFLTRMDGFLSRVFSYNIHYHPTFILHKIAPSAVYYVLGTNK